MGLLDILRSALSSSGPTTNLPPSSGPPGEARERTPKRAKPQESTATRKITRLATQGRKTVVGEQYQLPALKRVIAGRRLPPVGQWDAGLRMAAYLVREPANRYDRNAVMVQLPHGNSTEHVGYLPAEDAVEWQQVLRALEDRGRVAECRAMLYRGRNGPQVVLCLSDPTDALFDNDEPDEAHLLDAERQCAVTGEANHQDVLANCSAGQVWVTLHATTVTSGKYAGQATIEVRLDNQRIGELTAAQGQRYAEVLDAAPVVACEARIYEGSRYREVQVMLPKVD